MKTLHISLKSEAIIETAEIAVCRRQRALALTRKNGATQVYHDHDLFLCLAQARHANPDVEFLCKGAKRNVYPSRMSSQMSSGLVAYELELGKHGDQTVYIFDFDDKNITNSYLEQKDFYLTWLKSL
ncbi:hypothetical protein [Pseudomonas fitomaticsae]|uniref:Uncharacterized protein n=1 Tax=Pseudomonas fitomaticsae TaxID=2837969 RepID=A0ABY3PW80_9PSED|nr:hypothetical protein [Pseudomonas fitomaticsae]UFP98025.1 hypothetical protein KJY40_18410 [Pseudomonas fitomaticsae]